MRVSRSDGLRCDFSTNKLTISMSNMSFCNFNSKCDGRRYDFFFKFKYSSSLSTSESCAKTALPDSFECFFCFSEIFVPNTALTSRMPPRVLAVWAKRGTFIPGDLGTSLEVCRDINKYGGSVTTMGKWFCCSAFCTNNFRTRNPQGESIEVLSFCP